MRGIAHAAAKAGNHLALAELLRLQPSLADAEHAETGAGYTPLHAAAESRAEGALECASLLLKHGASVEAAALEDRCTPLVRAVGLGNERVARLLLSRGADPAVATLKGFQPLHLACSRVDEACVRLLLEYKAPVEATSTVRRGGGETHRPPFCGAWCASSPFTPEFG